VEFLTLSVRTFNQTWASSINLVSKLTAIESRYAISAKEIQDAMRKIGKSAEIAGIGFDRLIGVITATKEISRESGNFIGNAYKTIFARAFSNETRKELEAVGIKIFETE